MIPSAIPYETDRLHFRHGGGKNAGDGIVMTDLPAPSPPPHPPLNYAPPGLGRRPTVLIAAGVMSIVVALAAIGVNGFLVYVLGASSLDEELAMTPSATWYPLASPLTPQQANAVRQYVLQSAPPGDVNMTQATALDDYLMSSGQALFYSDRIGQMHMQIHSIGTMSRGGPVKIDTLRGLLTLSTDGQTSVTLSKQAFHIDGW